MQDDFDPILLAYGFSQSRWAIYYKALLFPNWNNGTLPHCHPSMHLHLLFRWVYYPIDLNSGFIYLNLLPISSLLIQRVVYGACFLKKKKNFREHFLHYNAPFSWDDIMIRLKCSHYHDTFKIPWNFIVYILGFSH